MYRWLLTGLLILCMGGWVFSAVGSTEILHYGRDSFGLLGIGEARVQIGWGQSGALPFSYGWTTHFGLARVVHILPPNCFELHLSSFLGFSYKTYSATHEGHSYAWTVLTVPCWFPTTLAALFTLLIWRRAKRERRGFPVELAPPQKDR